MMVNQLRQVLVILLLVALSMVAMQVSAHETRFSTLQLNLHDYDQPRLSVELGLLDLELALHLDNDSDGTIYWYEYESRRLDIEAYIIENLRLRNNNQTCELRPLTDLGGIRPGKTPSVHSVFKLECAKPLDSLQIDFQLLTSIDAASAAILQIADTAAEKAILLEAGVTEIKMADSGFLATNLTFVKQGIYHILIGLDHLAFLLLLILPVARRGTLRDSALSVLGIVTAFTLAHSVTLALSATGLIVLPGAQVEIVIAASVVLAGIINLVKPTHRMGWTIAYGFGLVHGFGFAGALAELAGGYNLKLENLAAFNIGVEIGQIALVALVLPILGMLGTRQFYIKRLVPFLSLLLTGTGLFWVFTRLA